MQQDSDDTRQDDEIVRLRAEVAALRASLAKRKSALQAANEARSARSAQLDETVAGFARELPPHFHDLWDRGFLRREVTRLLNQRGIGAPRGGGWTTKQVQRALDRHADREQRQSTQGSDAPPEWRDNRLGWTWSGGRS